MNSWSLEGYILQYLFRYIDTLISIYVVCVHSLVDKEIFLSSVF